MIDEVAARILVVITPRRSLRRRAKRTRAALMHPAMRRRTVLERLWRGAQFDVRAHLGILVAAVGILFLPLPGLPIDPLEDERTASEFLSTLWQVSATAIGLTLAFVIFAVQIASSGERMASRSVLLAESGVMLLFTVGASALVVIGLALLHLGEGAPAGWAASWAVGLAGIGIVWLLVTVVRTLPLLEPDRLFARRVASMRREARAFVDQAVLRRLGDEELKTACAEAGLRWMPINLGRSEAEHETVPARHSGRVSDVRLWKLTAIGEDVGEGAECCVRFEGRVRERDALLVLPSGAGRRARRAARGAVVVMRGDRRPRLEAFADLHDEIMAAIGQRNDRRIRQLQSAVVEVLLEFEVAWRLYGQRFEPGFDSDPDHPLGIGSLDRIEGDLIDEVAETIRVDPGATSRVLGMAWHLAMEGHRADAPALTSGALRILRRAMLTEWPDEASTQAVREAALTHLFAYVQYALVPGLRDAADVERQRDYMDSALGVLADIERAAVERGDTHQLAEIDRRWRDTASRARVWPGDSETPSRWLSDRRSARRLAVLAWCLRELPPSPRYAPFVESLSQDHGEFADIVVAAGDLLALDSGRWDIWQLEGRSGVGNLPSFEPMLLRAIALALLSDAVPGRRVVMPRATPPWLGSRREEIDRTLMELSEKLELEDGADRVATVKAALDELQARGPAPRGTEAPDAQGHR